MLRYDLVDVFTDRPFAGNQLAVVHDAAHLSVAQLHAIASEFNLSETTFPTPRGAGEYDVRIFTPAGEIPFAGHPTLGTAWVLRSAGALGPDGAVQHCGAGQIKVRFDGDRVELSATPRDLSAPVSDEIVEEVLGDLGLSADDHDGAAYVAGAGLNFLHLPVRADAIGRAEPARRPVSRFTEAVGPLQDPFDGINLFSVSGTAPELTVRSRVFVPELSVPEDPATGSAAAGLGMALVAAGLLPDGGRYEITQGVELGRPSRLSGRVDAVAGRATECHVAGGVHHVGRGEIAVPPDMSGSGGHVA
ncbi:PhzF family phenazine biosynthesis protein [Nocardioides speluncae]|uniref:PhzF family phenazine biosynthesis protein n=1 Tax=Nocardioides speluncae TaxID=2670337 RepID=UPI000D68B46C|nr:PhzF family phenazine biosynthesis protein [Nocardioides speluncae]